MKDYYNILGIKRNASHDEIRKAYWGLALKFHPDRNEDQTTDIFKDINEAKHVLLNEEKRKEYDTIYLEKSAVGALLNKLNGSGGSKKAENNGSQRRKVFERKRTRKRVLFATGLSAFLAIVTI